MSHKSYVPTPRLECICDPVGSGKKKNCLKCYPISSRTNKPKPPVMLRLKRLELKRLGHDKDSGRQVTSVTDLPLKSSPILLADEDNP